MFEKASEIRAAQRAKIWQRGLDHGREQEREEIRKRLLKAADQCPEKDRETGNIPLTPEDIDFLLGRGKRRRRVARRRAGRIAGATMTPWICCGARLL